MDRRGLFAGAALLYLGPLLAGMSGAPPAQIPVFVALFLMWLALLNPGAWPATVAAWLSPGGLAGVALRAAVQLALVAMCFAVGRGLAAVLGARMALPGALPLAISALGIGLGRLAWSPDRAAGVDRFMDDALARIAALSRPEPDRSDWPALLAPVLDLPDTTPDAQARAAVARAMRPVAGPALVRDLARRLSMAPGRHRAARRGLILWATDPAVAEAYLGCGIQTEAIRPAEGEPDLLELHAARTLALLSILPEACEDCPSVAYLRELSVDVADPAASALLRRLAARLVELAPQDPA